MCGILAYFNREGVSAEKLKQSYNALTAVEHRGPDSEGLTLINTRTGVFHNVLLSGNPSHLPNSISLDEACTKQFDLILGHRRLSIIDLSSNAHQPMTYSNNWLVFNGEIYNYLELREELKKLGHIFKTESDTEVIHAAYLQWGEKCPEKFNGMFTIVLFDSRQRKIFTANDRFGVKPLYFFANAKEIAFFSEVKQVYSYDFSRTLHKESIDVFLNFGYLDYTDATFYNEVKRHKPAHYSFLDLNSDEIIYDQARYYDINQVKIVAKEAVDQFKEIFTDAVKLRLRSDVPLGFACSGGLDSSAVLYTANQLLSGSASRNISTFSALFPGKEGDESKFVGIIEKDLKLNSHHVNPLEEFNMDDFERHVFHQDYPIQSTSFYAEWCVYKKVREKGIKVLLVGQGADEILGGYHHHFYRYCRELILKGKIDRYLSVVKKYAEIKSLDADKLHSAVLNEVKLSIKFKTGLADLGHSLQNKWNSVNKLAELLKIDMTQTMLPTYLRCDDRNSMAFGVETRHPFLDYRLVDFCFSLPPEFKISNDGWQKWILRESASEMPDEIRFRRDKKGFTTPQSEWIATYQDDFNGYLTYIPDNCKKESRNKFLKYSLGAWFKLNKVTDQKSRVQCKTCVLDNYGPTHITFNNEGVCNYCEMYNDFYGKKNLNGSSEKELKTLISRIKEEGKRKRYDCLLGVSGGVDSSYLAYLCKKFELRPLIVHFDNGWDSELAVKNIQTILSKLNYDLNTYVVDWEEFKNMQRAYIKAGVIDVEALTDHAIYATILQLARENDIKYVLSGFNYSTEAIMPKGWTWKKHDWANIKDICQKYGVESPTSFPHVSFTKKLYYRFFVKPELIQLLNYIDYDKEKAKKILMNELGWIDYGGKHYESIFTRFYQSYILPVKFGVDKRKAHLSNLVISGQISKGKALEELERPIYDPVLLKEDKEYVLKKLDFTADEFDTLMKKNPVQHSEFKTEDMYWNKYFRVVEWLKKVSFRS